MKLLKKLLPLVGVATTAAAVVPMTVSCGTTETSFNALDDIDTSNWERSKNSTLTSEDAIKEYVEAVKNSPEILMNDFKYGRNRLASSINHLSEAVAVTANSSINPGGQSWSKWFEMTDATVTIDGLKLVKANAIDCISFDTTMNIQLKATEGLLYGGLVYSGMDQAYASMVTATLLAKYDLTYTMGLDANVVSAPFGVTTISSGDYFWETIIGVNLEAIDSEDLSKIDRSFLIDSKVHVAMQAFDKDTGKYAMDVTNFLKGMGLFGENTEMECYVDYETINSPVAEYSMEVFQRLLIWPSYYFCNTIVESGE